MSEGAKSPFGAKPTPAAMPRWPHYTLAGVVAGALAGWVWVRLLWESPFGNAIPNLISYSLGALVAIVFVFWLANFAPLPVRTRRWAAGAIVLGVIGYAATIREIEWTGDMELLVHHRWEQTDAQRLADFRNSQSPLEVPSATVAAPLRPEDMPTYRGADSRGVVIGPQLSQDWTTQPPREVWRQPCGGGYAQLVVVPPYAVTIEQRGPDEAVVCYDAATGRERWVSQYPTEFIEAMGGTGPRATPTIAGDAVYSLGARGELRKLELATGNLQWRKDILEMYKAPNTQWALSSAPLVLDGLVFVNPGGPAGDGLVALDTATGEQVWARPGALEHADAPDDGNLCGYSTPFMADVLGVRQLLLFDGTGLYAYDPVDGALLWNHPHTNSAGVNVAQPLVFDYGRIFISCSYNIGCTLLQISRNGEKWKVQPEWTNQNLRCKFTSPVLHEGYIYGLDEGILVCIDPETGHRMWKTGRYGHGQLLLTNDQLLVHAEDGWAVLIDPSPERLREVTKFRTFDDPKNWNPPALVDGKLYLRNHREMGCFDLCGSER